jgi:hypothetical protein
MATPAGFETERQPNRFADLQSIPAKLGVPLGSGEIAWRRRKAVRLGPAWARSCGEFRAGCQPAGVAHRLRPSSWAIPNIAHTRLDVFSPARDAGPAGKRARRAPWSAAVHHRETGIWRLASFLWVTSAAALRHALGLLRGRIPAKLDRCTVSCRNRQRPLTQCHRRNLSSGEHANGNVFGGIRRKYRRCDPLWRHLRKQVS